MALASSLALLLALASPALAQQPADALRWADSVRVLVDRATVAGDLAAVRAAGALAERALVAFPDDALLLHYQGFALYREAVLRQGMKQTDGLDDVLERTQKLFERSIERRPLPESYAILSSVMGMRIGSNPLRGMTMGPASSDRMDKAEALGASNPRVWLMKGQSAIFTPKMFGGGLDKALRHLERAAQLFETDQPARGMPAWGKAEVYAWLGQVHQKNGDAAKARAAYARALELEPGYPWVQHVLLPTLDRPSTSNR